MLTLTATHNADPPTQPFHEWLKQQRLLAGLSTVDAGRRAGVTDDTVRNYETAGWSRKASTLSRLARAYEIDVQEMFDRWEQSESG